MGVQRPLLRLQGNQGCGKLHRLFTGSKHGLVVCRRARADGIKTAMPTKKVAFFCGVHPQIVVIIDYVFDVLVAGQPVGHCDVENMLL